jgi:signal transduction histidine kinase
VGGRVNVTASNTQQKVLVKIEDDGVGIPAEAIPHVFEEFYRADNVKAEAVEGTGLGLSIVSRILEVHGGEIWVESKEGQGATFSFTLPAAGKTDE